MEKGWAKFTSVRLSSKKFSGRHFILYYYSERFPLVKCHADQDARRTPREENDLLVDEGHEYFHFHFSPVRASVDELPGRGGCLVSVMTCRGALCWECECLDLLPLPSSPSVLTFHAAIAPSYHRHHNVSTRPFTRFILHINSHISFAAF